MLDCECAISRMRQDIDARHSYQRIYFRNANHPINRPSVITRKQDRAALAADQGKEPIPKYTVST